MSEIARPSIFGSVTKRSARGSMSSERRRLWRRALPGAELVGAAGVAEREHRLGVARPARSGRPGRPPTRWVGESGVTQLRVGLLELAQLAQQRVVDVVADDRVVEHVVAVVVLGDLVAQLGRALRRVPCSRGAHAAEPGPPRPPRRARRRGRSARAKPVEPAAVGEVEVDRGDRDAAARDRREVGARLVLEGRARSRRSGSGGGPSSSSSTSFSSSS